MNKWEIKKFGGLCSRVSVGHVGQTTQFFCESSVGIPLVRSQNVRPGRLVLENVLSVTKEFHSTHKKSQLKEGDILFVRVGANRGDCCVVPPGVGELNCANIVFARPIFGTGFFTYFFQSPLGRSLLLSVSVGAAQGVINTKSIADLFVPVPEIEEQIKIVNILSSLDNKNELNRKINDALEETGQLLFRQWFINFEFPWDFEKNHFSWSGKPYKSSGGEMVNSELGNIPKGWEVKDIDSTFDFKGGAQPPKSTHIYECKKGYVRFIQNRDYASINNLTYIKESSRNKLCDEFDILMDKYGEVGKIRCGIAGAYNVALAKIDPLLDNFREYLRGYFSQTYIQRTIKSAATASTRGSLNKQVFQARKIVVPDRFILEIYEQYSKNLLESYFLRNKETAEITKLRDLLLPRLMSGKLRVPTNK